ncbi:hypothetical protein RD792_017689 [Penstemon davidsonii]|uniref:Germin-like protein n=1 Tax=Penstemon davidsonii TaxID=160366 RepID=A0ABR0DW08_9LAMI|nr:hypothetical protein RD792_017689 [Penstemon davidsonii]
MAQYFILLIISALISIALAFGPAPLQDFCVADPTSTARGNRGLACKNPTLVQANDFFFSGLQSPGNTTNPYGASIIPVTVATLPGLNTLGISIARLDLAPNGVIPPHLHPRGSEILTVLEGSLQVGFVTSNPGYNHFNKTLQAGDVFVVPVGLVHYQFNAGSGNTVVIAALNSESPGIIAIPNAIFGAKPDIGSDYLATTFQLDKKIVDQLLAKF